MSASTMGEPDESGRFGEFGGRFIPESLMPACLELEDAFRTAWADDGFRGDFERLRNDLPRNARSPRYRGELLALHGRAELALGALEEARRTFRTALRIDERCLPALIGIAQVSRAERRHARSQLRPREVQQLAPQLLGLLVAILERHERLHDFHRQRIRLADHACFRDGGMLD